MEISNIMVFDHSIENICKGEGVHEPPTLKLKHGKHQRQSYHSKDAHYSYLILIFQYAYGRKYMKFVEDHMSNIKRKTWKTLNTYHKGKKRYILKEIFTMEFSFGLEFENTNTQTEQLMPLLH